MIEKKNYRLVLTYKWAYLSAIFLFIYAFQFFLIFSFTVDTVDTFYTVDMVYTVDGL